jgi:tRNA G18 (ribose-2'-O)-methylase SpoU
VIAPPGTLVGDAIEIPGNALALLDCARMFGVDCRFRDTKGLAGSVELLAALGAALPVADADAIGALHPRTIAFDNDAGASDVCGLRPGPGFALLVGNERRGLSHGMRALATHAAHVPMRSRRVNCLNVAAAAAVGLYYLRQPQALRRAERPDPERRRPDLLLAGPRDHVELGSALRSAAALGWPRAFVEDRHRVWFGVERAIRAEGRGAARRGRNDIHVVPATAGTARAFAEVVVVTAGPRGVPLAKADLARGPRQLIVVPDESRMDAKLEGLRDPRFARVELPFADAARRYRLVATIVMAEVDRQVGTRSAPGPRRRAPYQVPTYDRALGQTVGVEAAGELVPFEELLGY